jgi:excisionase family DNA binding protein
MDSMDLMDVQMVANALKLSRSKVYKMAENNELQSVYFGKSLRVSKEHVNALIADKVKGGKNTGANKKQIEIVTKNEKQKYNQRTSLPKVARH